MGKLALLAEQTAYERYGLRSATPLVKGPARPHVLADKYRGR
jgi:hypothetical protein